MNWELLMREPQPTNIEPRRLFECLSLAECMNDPENRAEISPICSYVDAVSGTG